MVGLGTELRIFLWSFISHWQTYVTGGVVTGVITVWERLRSKTLPTKIYFLIFIVSFSIAGFFTGWREQYERAEKAEGVLGKNSSPAVQVNVSPAPVTVIAPSNSQPSRPPTPQQKHPYNTELRIVRYERSPYELGKPVFINTYLRYDGENPARLRGYYRVFVAVGIKEGDMTPEKLTAVGNDLWSQMVAGMKTPDHGIMIQPKSNFWMTLNGPALTAEQVDELQTKGSGAVLFLGNFRWNDGIGDFELDFCALTQANPEVFINCSNHNGPVRRKE